MSNIDYKAMYQIGYGLYVVSANDGKDNGCIVNTVVQLTDTPLRVAVTVNKSNYTYEQILATGKLNVSVLSEDAPFSLFERFGFQSGRETDKWQGFDYWRTDNGLTALTGEFCNTVFSLQVEQVVDLDTHGMFICQVTQAEVLTPRPTMTYAYYHAHVKPKPAAAKGWVCKICGYRYEGEVLPVDFICPLCKHGAVDFEKI